jgi:maleylpyruvate isomerase
MRPPTVWRIPLKFHGYFRSSAAYRCRIAFNLKGVRPEFESIHLRKGEQRSAAFLTLNPQGLVPALETDGHVLTQSLAIIEWLDETHPAPPLLPRDAFDRAHVRALALSIACEIHPFQNLRVLKHMKNEYGQDQAGLDRWCRHWIEPGLTAFESAIANSGKSGAFCFGDTPTLADICLVPQMFSADRFGADVSKLTNLQRILKTCDAHPAFAAAHPSRQPDAEA